MLYFLYRLEGDFFMGIIQVRDYLVNLTKYDDIDTDRENRIILDKYIERIHADKLHCHKPYYHGTKEPHNTYSKFRIKSPYSIYLAKERRSAPTTILKDNVEKFTKVHNEAMWGKIYNDCGVNSVEGSVAYQNTYAGKLYYSITQHLRTLSNCNYEKLAFNAPNFFLHLQDMLEKKEEYLKTMTEECFDDLTNGMIAAIISGDTDMHGCSTMLLRPIYADKYTDICRIGLEEHAYDDIVEKNGSYQDIKNDFENKSQIYSCSLSSSNTRVVLTPRQQIENIKFWKEEGFLSPSNIQLIEKLANYNVDECLKDRQDKSGAVLTQSHADAIKYYLSQAEDLCK